MEKAFDKQYQNLPYKLPEVGHHYGENIHILSTPVMMTHLAAVCSAKTTQPEANRLFTELYLDLLKTVINQEFPRAKAEIPSRMIEQTERGVYLGETIDLQTKVAVAMVARAGILPSQLLFDQLNLMLNPEGVRLDCFFVARSTDQEMKVTGADVASAKIGGRLDGRILLLPDPMGATGSSIVQTLDTYRNENLGDPAKIIAMHLIVTPEYLKNLKQAYPEAVVYAVRLDRGLSSPEVLRTTPGERWNEERGLTDIHYIVPGGGGIGEVMTNSWI